MCSQRICKWWESVIRNGLNGGGGTIQPKYSKFACRLKRTEKNFYLEESCKSGIQNRGDILCNFITTYFRASSPTTIPGGQKFRGGLLPRRLTGRRKSETFDASPVPVPVEPLITKGSGTAGEYEIAPPVKSWYPDF